jgi:hypothetical protein
MACSWLRIVTESIRNVNLSLTILCSCDLAAPTPFYGAAIQVMGIATFKELDYADCRSPTLQDLFLNTFDLKKETKGKCREKDKTRYQAKGLAI